MNLLLFIEHKTGMNPDANQQNQDQNIHLYFKHYIYDAHFLPPLYVKRKQYWLLRQKFPAGLYL